jgi:indolepyruvate ferredoxin oxidoreductase beta subunit
MNDTINFLLVGVGGQGTILASDVLVNVGLSAGLQAKQAEVHGLSQRGGSVTSHVRWGRVVYSPLVGAGEADVYLAFEKLEALRHLNKIQPGALAVINLEAILPMSLISGDTKYPDDEFLRSTVAHVTRQAVYIDAAGVADTLGNNRVANIVLLGALSVLLENLKLAGMYLTPEIWLQVIAQRVPPKYVDVNKRAFQAGREAVVAPA